MNSPDPVLLILDLDETLIHAAEDPLQRQADFVLGPYHVYCRPHLGEFLKTCTSHYRIGVWSSSGRDYAEGITRRVMPGGFLPEFIWSRERCTRRFDHECWGEYYVKDLKKLKRKGYDLRRVLIVEDTPKKVERHYGNAIYISPFLGAPDDAELVLLAAYLESIHTLNDVRKVEKRNWKSLQRGS